MFDTVLYQFLETGTSIRTIDRSQSTPQILRFQPIPLSFFLYSPFKHEKSEFKNSEIKTNKIILIQCLGELLNMRLNMLRTTEEARLYNS